MSLDPVILARILFAFTITFHIMFPTMSIGLATFLAIVEGLWLKTKDPLYLQIYRFWLGIFAMGFGVGVVTGIVMAFEFGTNFAKFAQLAGPVIGSLLGYEVLTAFFLEAGFLGIMLFGMPRVGPRLHFFATLMVALGTTISASWILAGNSWMQTPDGVAVQNGQVVVTDWLRVIFNPSYLHRLPHMLMAAYLTGFFMVAGVGRLVSAARQAQVVRAPDRLARHGLRHNRDRRPGLPRRYALRDDAALSARQNPGGRRFLGEGVAVARSLLPDHLP